jgi:hypothetical protein
LPYNFFRYLSFSAEFFSLSSFVNFFPLSLPTSPPSLSLPTSPPSLSLPTSLPSLPPFHEDGQFPSSSVGVNFDFNRFLKKF